MSADAIVREGPIGATDGTAVAKAMPTNGALTASEMNGGGVSIAEILHMAVQRGTPAADLKELVALYERISDRAAAQEFARAMAAFQAECPPIKKENTAKIKTGEGTGYSFTYAPLDDIVRAINPVLLRHGLSYTWDSVVDKDMLTCTCTVRHVNGHSVPSKFTLPIANNSGMSPQQKVGSANHYAQRQSLTAALGLVMTDDDPEAAQQDPTPITDDQATEIEDLLAAATEGKSDAKAKSIRARFLRYLDVDAVSKIPAVAYDRAVAALQPQKQEAPT